MAVKTIETRAVISAEDRTGPAFAAVVQHMAKMEDAARRAKTRFAEMTADKFMAGGGHARIAQINAEQIAARRLHADERAARQEARLARREELAHLREVNRLQKEMTRHGVGRFVAEGAANAVAAHSIAETIVKNVEAGAERQHVRVGMMNAGMRPDEIARSEAASLAASRGAPNMSVTEIMELHKEARSAAQHPEEAFALLPQLAKAASVLKGMGVENANVAEIVKAGESLGLMNDPARFRKYLDGQVRAMAVMGKTINTEQVYEAAKYSKAAGSTLSDDFINLVMPSLIQEMHGSSAGDALSMMSKTLRGGLQHKHLPVERLNELGMLEDPSKIRRTKTGQIMGYAGKVVGDADLARDPDKFARTYNEHMEAHGIKAFEDKVKVLQETLPGTAANLIRILIQQEETLKQHRENYKAAPGLDQASANQLGDASVAVGNLSKSLNDLGAAVTAPAMATIGTTLSSIAAGVRSLGAAAKDHPLIAMSAGAAVAGGALAGSGVMAYNLANGFGLGASATALEGSAAALDAAAVRLGAGSAIGTAGQAADHFLVGGNAIKTGAKAAGLFGLGTVGTAGLLGGALLAFDGAMIYGAPKLFGTAKGTRYGGKQGQPAEDPDHPGMHFVSAPRRGSSGYWAANASPPAPMPSLAPIAAARSNLPMLAGPGGGAPARDKVAVDFNQPPPIRVIVEAGSSLLSVVNDAKAASVQLKAQVRADTGPGGLGETSTGQH